MNIHDYIIILLPFKFSRHANTEAVEFWYFREALLMIDNIHSRIHPKFD